MIQKALEYLVNLRRPAIVTDSKGREYTEQNIVPLDHFGPGVLKLTTLTGILDYMSQDPEAIGSECGFVIHVESPTAVSLYTVAEPPFDTRRCLLRAEALTPKIPFGAYLDAEAFVIMLQAMFEPVGDREKVLQIAGNVREENVRQIGDDGISQEVTVRAGIAKAATAVVPNPVILAPFRTFAEITQPESSFVFRMKEGPMMAVFEADGGAWRGIAVAAIKSYFADMLPNMRVAIENYSIIA